MSVDQIQNFLDAQVPNCDTYGTQKATDWGRSDLTHAQFATQVKGWPGPPYVCLRNYYEVPKTSPGAGIPDNSYNHNGNPPAGSISAAQMIYNAEQQYHISAKVLLVKIQTESSGPLTQDSWPLASQYTYAMAAHCPDSGPGGSPVCDPNYAGFSIQISEAAKLLRSYLDGMDQSWWGCTENGIKVQCAANRDGGSDPGGGYKVPFTNDFILYNPSRSCGGTTFTIQTKATAALYTYTPYQPNAGALGSVSNTSQGGTAACGAYGNRNFWWWFNKWFGSSQSSGEILTHSLGSNQLTAGTTLHAGDYIVSPNGKFVTTLQYDGNLVTYSGNKAVWYSNTYGDYGDYATFQADGNLVVYAYDGSALWDSHTQQTGADNVTLGDDGNLRIYAGSTQKYSTNNRVNSYAVTSLGTQISSETRMKAGDYLQSPDGRFSLVMQADGNLVVYAADATALWNSHTNGNPGAFAAMQSDGNLVVYASNGKPLWASGTSGQSPTLTMQSDGNLVVYASNGKAIWNTVTWQNNYQVNDYEGYQISTGARLGPTEYLRSSDWRYRLVMQNDGNLVLYSVNRYSALWSSGTWGNPGASATMQSDGNLVVYSATGKALWSSGTWGNPGASVAGMQPDGNLVVYSNNRPTWASGTNGKF